MESIDWLLNMVLIAGTLLAIFTVTLAIFTRGRLRQSEEREKRYRQNLMDFRRASRDFEKLPFSFRPWNSSFSRLEPFTANDAEIVRVAEPAFLARKAFVSMPGKLFINGPVPGGFWAMLFDVPGNIRCLQLWRDDDKSLANSERILAQMQGAFGAVKTLLDREIALCESVIDKTARMRQSAAAAASAPHAFAPERAAQVKECVIQAGSILDRAAEVLQDAPLDTYRLDGGARIALANHFCEIAGLLLRHVSLLDAIAADAHRIDEAPLHQQLDALAPYYVEITGRQVSPEWESIQAAQPDFSAQHARLEEVTSALKKQIEVAVEYWKGLNEIIIEMDVETMRAQTAEKDLVPYLGEQSAVPQAWQAVSGVVGVVSEQLVLLRHDLKGLVQTENAQRPTEQNWTRFHEDREKFQSLRASSQALQAKLAEFRRERRELELRYTQNGRTAVLLNQLQSLAQDIPAENQVGLENLIYRINELKSKFEPEPGVNYKLLRERLEKLETEGNDTLRHFQQIFEQQRVDAAQAWGIFTQFRDRYQSLIERKPRVDKDWSEIDRWVKSLSSVNIRKDNFRKIDAFLKVYHGLSERYEKELEAVEQVYRKFDGRVADIEGECRSGRDELTGLADRVERSEWRRIFSAVIPKLREYSGAYANLIGLVRDVCNQPRMADALNLLDPIEQRKYALQNAGQDFREKYLAKYEDLENRLRFYRDTRAKFLNRYELTGTVALATADGYRDQALLAPDYTTARRAIDDAIDYLGSRKGAVIE